MQDVVYTPIQRSESTDINPINGKLTWEQLCLLYGTRLTRSGVNNTSLTHQVIYTVPDGKVFLLLTAQMSVWTDTNTDSSSYLMILPSTAALGTNYNIMRITSPPVSSGAEHIPTSQAVAINPSLPLKMVAGEKVDLYITDNVTESFVAITGYEIDAQLFYKSL